MLNNIINTLSFRVLVLLHQGTIVLHWVVFIGLLAAMPLAAAYQPWYIALVVIAFVVRTAFSPNVCPISALECYFARKIGAPEHKWFVKAHVLPAVRALNSHLGRLYAHLMANMKGS